MGAYMTGLNDSIPLLIQTGTDYTFLCNSPPTSDEEMLNMLKQKFHQHSIAQTIFDAIIEHKKVLKMY